MPRSTSLFVFCALTVLGVVVGPQAAVADDNGVLSGYIRQVNGLFVTSYQDPAEPRQPEQPELPELPATPISLASASSGSVWGGGVNLSGLPAPRAAAASVASIVQGEEAAIRATTDVGDLLEQSGGTNNVYLFRRSPISNEPRIRGYRYAQIRNTVGGAPFFPIRPDLDTALSRIDSAQIDNVLIIDGPYSVRLGPGFAFIDIQMLQTPRSECGTMLSGRTATSYDTNGKNWYGSQSFFGGGSDFGYRVAYSHRTGSDYQSGDGRDIAADHNLRSWNGALGYDLTPDSSIEFTYIRNDLTDMSMPSQINDLRFLTADAFKINYLKENQYYYDRLTIDGWYNRGNFEGMPSNTPGSKDPILANPDQNKYSPFPQSVIFFTNGSSSAAGARATFSWGDVDSGQLSIGADFNRQQQEYRERDTFGGTDFQYGLAPAEQNDTGVFADGVLPLTAQMRIKGGGRIDFLSSDSADTTFILPGNAEQSFTLGAGYVTGEYDLAPELTGLIGFGIAQRAPTPTDLYADQPYLSILQQGPLTFVNGNPELRKETSKQLDIGLRIDCSDFRGGVRGFYAWVDDFITYNIADTTNLDATLAGGEIYGDYDLTSRLTTFSSLSYVQGVIREPASTAYEPLWGVPPLQAIVGLRLHACGSRPRWGTEYRMRIVDDQHLTNFWAGPSGWEQPTSGFVTHDIRGYYHLTQSVTLVAGVENFGDRNYREHLDSRQDLNNLANNGIWQRGRNFYFLVEADY